MRTFFKIIKIAVLAFFIAIVVLAVAGWLLEDRITQLAVQKVSQTVKAPLGMESVTFSLIRDFPLATIQFNGLWLGASKSPFDSIQSPSIDTLARFDKFYVSVESRPLLDNIFNILEVDVEKGFLKYLVNEKGGTCYDFLITSDSVSVEEQDTTAGEFYLALDEVNLKSINLIYQDKKLNTRAKIFIPEVEGSARLDSVTTFVSAKGALTLTECQFQQTSLDKMQQAELQFDLLFGSDSLVFKNINLITEGASLDAKGKLFFGEETDVDMELSASGLDLAELRKYIPTGIYDEYKISQTSGTLELQSTIKGAFSDDEIPQYDARFILSKGRVKYADYPVMEDINIRGSATNGILQNTTTTSFSIDNLQLKSAGNTLKMNGSFSNLEQLHYNLNAKLTMDLQTLKPFIPDSLVQDIKGRAIADIETRGILPDSIDSQFADYLLQSSRVNLQFKDLDIKLDSTLAFSQASGKMKYKNHLIELDSFNVHYPKYDLRLVNNSLTVNLDKNASNIDSIRINLPNFYLEGPGSSIKGKATLKNPRRPVFSLETAIDADLSKIKRFIPDSLVKNMTGNVKAYVKSAGVIHLDSLAQHIPDLIYDKTILYVEMADVGVKMPDTLLQISQLTGNVNITPELITVQDLSGSYDDILFKTDSTVIKNLYHTAMRGKPGRLEVEGVYRFDHINYSELMALIESFTSEERDKAVDEKGSEESSSPWDYEIKGKFFVKSALYKKAYIRDISGLFNVKDSLYVVDQLQFKAFEGSMNTAIKIWFKPNGEMELFTRNKLDRMNIRRLLYEMENFDRTDFTYKNISGILTTEELFTRIVFSGDSVVYPETRMTGDFLLEEGGIYNFEPVEILAPSIPGIDRLDTLVFKTIETHLFVFKDTLCIPKTYVVSNKFDISTIGMQSFSFDFEYHLEVVLKEILLGTSKKRQREKENMEGIVEKDDKNAKWVQLYTERKEPKMRVFPNKRERDLMALAIKARNFSLNLRFNPKIVSFETKVSESFRSAF